MPVPRLQATLRVIAENFNKLSWQKQFSNQIFLERKFQENQAEFPNDIDKDFLKRSISELVNASKNIQEQEDSVFLAAIFEALVVIFSNTTQKERQIYLSDLLGYFYDALVEKSLATGQSSILSKRQYDKLIRKCLPFVKLELVQRVYKRSKILAGCDVNVKNAVLDLYECLICPKISKEECYDIVFGTLASKHYDLLKYELICLNEKPGSLGDYYKLKLTINYNEQLHELRYFAKFMLESNNAMKRMAENSFKKEEFMYTTMIPLLKQLGLESLTNMLPGCYLVRTDEVIVLEDVSFRGCASLDIRTPFEYDHLQLVVKHLAKLHACSLIFEEKMSESLLKTVRIDEYYGELLDEFLFNLETNALRLQPGTRGVLHYFLDKFSDIPKGITLEEFRSRAEQSLGRFYTDVKKSCKFRNVINHGDLWCNNILFGNGDAGPNFCYLVDFQLIRYCPPALDLLFFLHTNTNKENRDKYTFKLLGVYYLELKRMLNDHNIKLEEIYSWESFLSSCKDMKLAAVWQSLFYLQYVLIPKEQLDAMKADEGRLSDFFTKDRSQVFDELWDYAPFRTRIKENVQELYEICMEM